MPTEVTRTADLPHKVLDVSIYQGERGATRPGRQGKPMGDGGLEV